VDAAACAYDSRAGDEEGSVETVGFTRMADGTAEDYALLARYEEPFMAELPDRLLHALDGLKLSLAGYQVSRYEHSLQSASRAQRDGRSEEYVVAALLHDIGDELAPYTHGEMVGAVLRPYIAPEICWIVKHHGLFQMYYYAHHSGGDRNARDRYRDHPWFDACAEFCELYDQNCFDPAYESLPVETFEPMVRRVFAEPRYLDASVEP
jgi:predicted HD phosphohydrolase